MNISHIYNDEIAFLPLPGKFNTLLITICLLLCINCFDTHMLILFHWSPCSSDRCLRQCKFTGDIEMVLCYSNELCLNGSCIGSKYQCLYKQLWPHAGSQASHFLWQAVPLALLARDGFLIGVLSPLYTEMLLFDSSWQQDECPWRTKKSNPKPVKVNHFTFKGFKEKKNTCWILQRRKSLQKNPKHGGKFKNVVLLHFNLELNLCLIYW